jgi:hypothetical protein
VATSTEPPASLPLGTVARCLYPRRRLPALDEPAVSEALEQGRRLSADEAVALALDS